MKATDWFEKQPWIDKKRMAAAGASYGGYMMAWLNGHTDRFKVMVCHAGVFNYHSQMASDLVRGRERLLGAFPWNDLAQVDKQSAQRFSKNFQITRTLVAARREGFSRAGHTWPGVLHDATAEGRTDATGVLPG